MTINAKVYKQAIEKASKAALDDKYSKTPGERAQFFIAHLSGVIGAYDEALGKKVFAAMGHPEDANAA